MEQLKNLRFSGIIKLYNVLDYNSEGIVIHRRRGYAYNTKNRVAQTVSFDVCLGNVGFKLDNCAETGGMLKIGHHL